MIERSEISARISKSAPDQFGNFYVSISGVAEGEQFDWTPDTLYTDATWTAEEQANKIRQFKDQVETQFE